MNEVIATLEEIVESLKDGLPVNEVLASLRDTKLPGCEVVYQSGFVGEGRPSYPHFEIRTSHPKLDYVHYVEYDLLRPMSAEDKKELGDHLIVVLNAWLRELRRTPDKSKAFELHCRLTEGTHEDRARAWLNKHPDDKRTLEQVKKASKRYPYQKPRKPE